MSDETTISWWKRIGAREWLTVAMTVFALIVWAINLQNRSDNQERQIADLRERVTQQDQRITKQEEFDRENYVRSDVLKPTLDSMDKRMENIETYMRRITQ